MGLEPTPGPWQGPVLPLYYDRPESGKLYHVIRAAARSHPGSPGSQRFRIEPGMKVRIGIEHRTGLVPGCLY
jgi:hypothetical protein